MSHHSLFPLDVAALTKELDEFEMRKMEARAVTGVLASHPNGTDVHISSLSLTFHGQELLSDTSLELNSGRRYGLIGLNGTDFSGFCVFVTNETPAVPPAHHQRELSPEF
ncbi:ATP-binding cassette sub-family F member 2-like [Sinocyclocheilus rhinocerous]|uniref:ATP-binding cassette sub-family F member 2-like n=1 Tax=Sinocyclocheilus rhinocerous TaxID=307959 RepID=UPI0007B86BC0|nr:PREDICTED: ATP-binding cassette sub-family F member 2-like [Sinocyclocheilus rhinocerous]